MKNYTTPELKIVAFMAEENVAGNFSDGVNKPGTSNIFNDAEFDW